MPKTSQSYNQAYCILNRPAKNSHRILDSPNNPISIAALYSSMKEQSVLYNDSLLFEGKPYNFLLTLSLQKNSKHFARKGYYREGF